MERNQSKGGRREDGAGERKSSNRSFSLMTSSSSSSCLPSIHPIIPFFPVLPRSSRSTGNQVKSIRRSKSEGCEKGKKLAKKKEKRGKKSFQAFGAPLFHIFRDQSGVFCGIQDKIMTDLLETQGKEIMPRNDKACSGSDFRVSEARTERSSDPPCYP